MNDTQKKKQADHVHLLRNASCVSSDISWSVSIPIQEQKVVYRQTERRRRLYSYCVATPIGCFYKMAQVKIMYACSLRSDLAYS